MAALSNLQQLIESFCRNGTQDLFRTRNNSVSKWSIGEHYDHVMKGEHSVLTSLLGAKPIQAKPISLTGRVVLLVGWLPRGKGKAPAHTAPMISDAADLLARARELSQMLAQLATEPAILQMNEVVSVHPSFGGLNPGQWIRLLEIHRKHHEKICREILAASIR